MVWTMLLTYLLFALAVAFLVWNSRAVMRDQRSKDVEAAIAGLGDQRRSAANGPQQSGRGVETCPHE
jgi:hypothetical protein